jgi:hypothetical protein
MAYTQITKLFFSRVDLAVRSFSSLGSETVFVSYSPTPFNSPLIRSFASKKKKGKEGGGGGKEGAIKVMLFNDNEDEYFEKPVKDMKDLIEKVAKGYDVDKQEILDGNFTLQVGEPFGLWENLKTFNQVKEKQEDIPVPHIRLEELSYEDDEDDDDYMGDDKDYMGDDDEDDIAEKYGHTIDAVIRDLIVELRKAGWSRPDAGLLKKENGEELAARDYILQSSKEDELLKDILVSRVGAMDHILQCLEYEFLWEEVSVDYANDMDHDDDMDHEDTPKDAEFTEK